MAKEKVMVSEQYLQDIANSIRTKLETEDKYKPSEFSSKIDEMSIATPVTKGFIPKAFNSSGFITDVEFIGMTSIPSHYFYTLDTYGVGKYLTNVKFAENTTSINQYAFHNCRELLLTELPDTITSIGNYAFCSCLKISLTKLPSALTSVGTRAFEFCSKLAITEIPEGVTTLGSQAFANCSSLTSIKLPSTLSSIGSYMFVTASNLKTVSSLSEDLKNIYNYAFQRSGLSKLILHSKTVTTLGTGAFEGTSIASGSGKIYVPDNLVESFQTATNWSTYASKIKPLSELEVSE